MAQIPVEKKSSGLPWWGWLIALAVIVAVAWLLLAGDNDEMVVADSNYTSGTTAVAVSDAGPITSLSALMNADAVIGQSVSLMGVQVQSADELGGLFIGDEEGRRAFVSTAIPSGFAAGSRVNVTGTVQGGDTATAGRTGPPTGLPAGAAWYIEADSIQPA